MSFYATLQGEVQYPNQDSFDAVILILRNGDWLDAEGYFLDETSERFSLESDVNFIQRIIRIPGAGHRNLSRVDFFPLSSNARGTIVGASNDGCFSGWVVEDGIETDYELDVWAKDHLEADDKDAPIEGDYDSSDDYWENYLEWQSTVISAFVDDGLGIK